MLKKIALVCVATLLVLPFIGCAPKKPAAGPTGPMVWPDQPEEPRIAYIAAYHGAIDFYQPTFFEILFGSPPQSSLSKPAAVYVAGDRIYVALTGNASVAILDVKARKYAKLNDWGKVKIVLPLGLAGLPDGTIYVSDASAKAIFTFGPDGNFKSAFGRNDDLRNPAGIAFNADHTRLYVVDSKAHDVKVFAPDGKLLFKFGAQGKEPGRFFFPSTVAVSPKTGNLAIADTQNFRVQIFDQDGKFIRTIGELGDLPGMFSRPKGVAFDSEGHLYVSDYAFSNIQLFTEEGQLLMWFGSAGTYPGYFELPAGLFIDSQDRIYVADSLNNRVNIYQYLSESWKREHPDQYKVYMNPGPGTAAP